MLNKIKFLLLFALGFIGLEFAARNFFYTQTHIKEKVDRFENSYTDVRNLALGVCPLAYGLNPEMFSEKTYNLAYIDETLHFSLQYLKRELPRTTKLKNIIVELDPLIFFTDEIVRFGDETELAHQKMYIRDNLKYFDISEDNSPLTVFRWPELSNFFIFREALFPKIADCAFLGKCERENLDPLSENGFMPMRTSFAKNNQYQTDAQRLRINAEVNHYLMKSLRFENGKRNLEILKEMVKEATSHEVSITFVWLPFYSSFAAYLDKNIPAKWADFFQESVRGLEQTPSVKFLNFRDLIKNDKNENDFFFDVIHLNESGAAILSRRLNEELMHEAAK